ncbi:MAG: NAD(P)/FAD-dependent oxidoreductase [Desulforhopalus sp.]
MTQRSEVLIAGGGIIGLMCAYYLVQAGRGVTLIEKDEIGNGASRDNCGLIFRSDLPPLCQPGVPLKELKALIRGTSPLYIKPELNFDRLAYLIRFSLNCNRRLMKKAILARETLLDSSDRLYGDLFKSENLPCDYERKGVLIVHRTAEGMAAYGKVNRLLEPFGCAAVPLTAAELQRREPSLRDDLYGAWYHDLDSHLRPDRLLTALKTLLREKGVEIHEQCALEHWEEIGPGMRATTSEGTWDTDHLVLATGPWIRRNAQQFSRQLPIEPGKGYSITFSRPEKCPALPCYFYDQNVVATPWESGFRLGGTMEFSGFDTELNDRRINSLLTAAELNMKTPPRAPIETAWAALRPMSPDDLPVICRVPKVPRLYIATGHGMLGITAAPATGKLIAEMVCSQPPHINPEPFQMGRFQNLLQK